jgi:type II secretory pathway pseudopilin PulG
MNTLNSKNKGFTIVELLVAMAVFQVILVVTLLAYMQISRFYQKSINAARLQQVSNNVVDEITRTIQNTGGLVVVNNSMLGGEGIDRNATTKAIYTTADKSLASSSGNKDFKVLCVDTTRYLYRLDENEVGDSANLGDHVFMSDTLTSPAACGENFPAPGSTARVILWKDMSLQSFGVLKNGLDINGNSYNVWINASYTSDFDDIQKSSGFPVSPAYTQPGVNEYISCKGGSGRQYCAVTNINTTVVRRIGL